MLDDRHCGRNPLLQTTMWPAKVQRQFEIALKDGNNSLENVLHGPYNKLLYTMFPPDTDFTVHPNFQEMNSTKGADYLVTFEVHLENRPVFIVELKSEKNFEFRSKRAAADDQLRDRLGDLAGEQYYLNHFRFLAERIFCRILPPTRLTWC
jgi:hypothetical protein